MGKLDGERLWCLASLFQENIQRPEFLMFMVVLSILEISTFIMFREPFTIIFSSNSDDRTFSNCQEACCCSAASKFKPWFMVYGWLRFMVYGWLTMKNNWKNVLLQVERLSEEAFGIMEFVVSMRSTRRIFSH